MKKVYPVFGIVLLFITITPIAMGMGIADWSATTAYGTNFDDPGGLRTMTLANGEEYKMPEKWYFYRHHIPITFLILVLLGEFPSSI